MENLNIEVRDILCERIGGLKRRGVLGDWGYAVPTAPSESTEIISPSMDATSPIVGEPPVKYDNHVPTRKVGSQEGPTLVPTSKLTNQDDIALWMGTIG